MVSDDPIRAQGLSAPLLRFLSLAWAEVLDGLLPCFSSIHRMHSVTAVSHRFADHAWFPGSDSRLMEMAKPVKAHSAELNLSSVPGTHMVERGN